MVARAAEADALEGRHRGRLRDARSWIHVLVNCRLLSAERLVNFFTELRSDVPEAPRDDFMFAFREVLMNAMEHGGGFDPDQVVEVTAVRTARTMVFYLRDPGPGFDFSAPRPRRHHPARRAPRRGRDPRRRAACAPAASAS